MIRVLSAFGKHATVLKRHNIAVYRFPIKDMDVPSPVQMIRILLKIESCIQEGKILYLRCWGGVGRTGTVVGCYLLKQDIANRETVFKVINKLKQNTPLAIKVSPETTEQREFVLDWG